MPTIAQGPAASGAYCTSTPRRRIATKIKTGQGAICGVPRGLH
jgi:hypothetical protein